MSSAIFRKVIGKLPDVLEANCMYLVRTGAGFDLYLSDSTGSIAYPLNTAELVVLNVRSEYDAYTAVGNEIVLYVGP